MNKQVHLKNQQQTQSLQHLLNQHKKDFNAPDSVNSNNVPVSSIILFYSYFQWQL